MKWEDGSVRVHHPREAWALGGDDETIVHCRLDQMKGTAPEYGSQRATYISAYEQAKTKFSEEIALDIVDRCVTPSVIDKFIDLIYYSDRPIILVFPHVSFDDDEGNENGDGGLDGPKNAIPFAFAQYLAEISGAKVNETIIQVARVGRTHLPKWVRFLCQPAFEGAVDPKAAYIIVDDAISTGGTFAALRSYILGNGGTVAGTTALANKEGLHQKFAIADQTVTMLKSGYGPDLYGFWARTFGHDIDHLTETEGRFLLGAIDSEWPGAGAELLQRLRERFNHAAATFG